MDNDPKRTEKATAGKEAESKEWNILQWPSQSSDQNPKEQLFSY